MKTIRRIIGKATKAQFITLAVLCGLLAFLLKDIEVSIILIVLGLAIIMGVIIYPFAKGRIIDNDDPFEPGSDAYFTYGPGSED